MPSPADVSIQTPLRERARVASERAERPVMPSLRGSEPPNIVHVAAECWPYARTGGLGEAVSTLAHYQTLAGCGVTVVLPLYRAVRESHPDLQPLGPAFSISFGSTVERARFYAQAAARDARRSGVTRVLFVEHDAFFDRPGLYGEDGREYPDNARRFAFLSRAAVAALPMVAPRATVLHAHDWHAALTLMYARQLAAGDLRLRRLTLVQSIHNACHQGRFMPEVMNDLGLPWSWYDWRALEWYGRVNFLKGGTAAADAVIAVSPTYGRELRTVEGGFGLHEHFRALGDRLVGVVNGIDQNVWNPATDPLLPARFSASDLTGKARCKAQLQASFSLPAEPRAPVFALCARLTEQKGIGLLLGGAWDWVPEAQVVVLGEGDAHFVAALRSLAAAEPHRVAVATQFRDDREHLLVAGADAVLMPSLYEPCGLAQLRAQRYGALPVARRVGGLADTIADGMTGFHFDEYDPAALGAAMARAMMAYCDREGWHRLVRAAMAQEFGWERSARVYFGVYRRARHRAEGTGFIR
jgi:starch synthase